MVFTVTNPSNITDGGSLELDGAGSIASATVGNATFVFVAGGVDDGVSVFQLNTNGTLTNVTNVTDAGALELDGATGLSTGVVDGNTYLFVAGKDDNGISVFRVGLGGTLTNVQNITDNGSIFLGGVTDTATARVGNNTYLFTADSAEDGVQVFRVKGTGELAIVGNIADGPSYTLAGVNTLTTASVSGNTYLFAGSKVENGVTVFSISSTGAFTYAGRVTDGGALNLAGASDLTTATVGGVTYLFAAGATDNGVSVFSIAANGALTNVSNVTDSASTLIAGASSVSVVTLGTTSYLSVGGTENGASLFRVESGGALTFIDNIADAGSRALGGTTTTAAVSVNGTSYVVGAGASDDGVSIFGSKPSGTLVFAGAATGQASLNFVNSDGGNQTKLVDGSNDTTLGTANPMSLGLDTAAGFYFAIANNGGGDSAQLVRGSLGGGAVTTLFTYYGPNGVAGNAASDDTLVNALQVDAVNHRIYVGEQEYSGNAPAASGIRQYSYDAATGAVTDLGFLVTLSASTLSKEGSAYILDPYDFALDLGTNSLFYTQLLAGGANSVGLYRLNLASPDAITQVVIQGQFPDNASNGLIRSVEVDTTTGRLYFDTAPKFGSGYVATQNKVWWIPEAASNGTATELTLNGLPAGNHLQFGTMAFDQAARQLYVASDEVSGSDGANDDVVYVFQLDASGNSATLIRTIPGATFLANDYGNFGGMAFNAVPTLTVAQTTAAAIEQAAGNTAPLSGNPTIIDADNGNLASASVQISGGTFSSNETSSADDHLGFGAARQIGGLVSGTNITLGWDAATETLTLTGLDTIAHYQSVLGGVQYWATGDNPSNYGLNAGRTLTYRVNDGTFSIPGGAQNSTTATFSVVGVNDAPVNLAPGSSEPTVAEDSALLSLVGPQISDVDTNPTLTAITVTLSVQHGLLSVNTGVAGGLAAGDVTDNGSGTVTLTGTITAINATLADLNGVRYQPLADYYGADALKMVTSDGAWSDTDSYGFTVAGSADIAGDTVNLTEDAGATPLNLLGNDSFENIGRSITAVGSASHGSVTINTNGTVGTSDDYVVYTPTADYFGTDSFTYTVTSGGATETATVTVDVGAVADITQDSFTVSAGETRLDVLANDTFEDPSRAIIVVSSVGQGSVAINDNGTPGDDTDDYIVYTAPANFNGSANFTYTVASGGETETATVTLTIVGSNQAPVIDLNGAGSGTSATLAYTENAAAVAIAPAATVTDTNSADFNGGSLTVAFTANGTAADQLTIQNQGTGAGQIGVVGANVSYNGATIGTFTGGTNGSPLEVTFTTAAASLAAVQALEQHILYANSSDTPSTAPRTMTFTAVDGGGTANGGADTGSATATITVTAVDDAPVAVADTGAVLENGTTTIAVLANDTDVDGGAPIALVTVNGVALTTGQTTQLASGAIVTVNGDGTLGYNPNHGFDYLVSQGTATQTGANDASAVDSFAYTINGGSATTVAVTVNGVDSTGDQLRGSAGNDTVGGTGGNDYIDLSQGGTDSASGGVGNDGFYFGGAFSAADHVDGGTGSNDQVGLQGDYTGPNALTLGANTMTGVEVIAALAGFSYAITTVDENVGPGETLKIYGSDLTGGNDLTFNGSAETDGNFMVYGGAGIDTITTGAGSDGIYFGSGRFNPGTDHVDGGAGTNDQLALDGSYTVTISHAAVVNVETLVLLDSGQGSPATYAITLTDDWTAAGETHGVYAVGVRNPVTIDASAETNASLLLYGGQGGDTITGGNGTGTNWFNGGPGADTLTGGAGVDTFFYDSVAHSIGSSHDTIVNFNPGQDKIDLPFAVTAIDGPVTGNASEATLDADLTSALSSLGANHAVEFTATGALQGHVFEVIDANGQEGYQAGQDVVIELVAQTDHITTPAPFV